MRVFRTFARAYVSYLDPVLAPLSAVSGEPVGIRVTSPSGIQVATVGDVLVTAADAQLLEPLKATVATLIVDDLDECQTQLTQSGAQIIRGPQAVPVGRNLFAKLPGGVQIEYVEWTEDNHLRHSQFIGLRDDKEPHEVTREHPR